MIRRAMRWLAATITVALVLGTAPAPAAAFSYDATKIDPLFLFEVLKYQSSQYDVIVRSTAASPTGRADRAAKAVKTQGGNPKHQLAIVGGASARLNGTQVLALTRDADVDYVVKDWIVMAQFDPVLDSAKASSPGVLAVNAPQTWSQVGVTGRGIGVAIVDSGVYAHPDLAGRIIASIDFTSATPTVSTTTTTGDPGGHGTHVAGLVAGDGTRSGGAYTGVAPQANIINVRVIDANGSSNVSTILRALQWILANRSVYNIKVVNLSLGGAPTQSYKTDLMATAAEVLNFAGLTVVVSAGNLGPTAGTVTTPATDPYVVTVGALDDNLTPLLSDDLMTTFSSRGRTFWDNLSKPDVAAPGRRMVSLRAPGSSLDTLYADRQVKATGALIAEYFRLSGTSMAAPVVSGVIALMLERNPTLSPAQIKKRLKTTANPLAFGTSLDRGAGGVDAYKAVQSLDATKEYAAARVSDAFAKDMRRFIEGQPIVWRDLTYHGGVDSGGTTWEAVTWVNIRWDSITWENVTWEGFTWEGITWEGITWEAVTWETLDALSTGAQSGRGSGWNLVD